LAELRTRVGEADVSPADGWSLQWIDRRRGIARLAGGDSSLTVVVEGHGTDWFVTLRGRRIAVTVQSWREQKLAEAQAAEADAGGPVEIRATLPGLVVAIKVEVGAQVSAGESLLTIEAMKMHNEVRSPRDGTIGQLAVEAGQPVASGVLLVRLD
jgi:biotin carboxyl carrier protein